MKFEVGQKLEWYKMTEIGWLEHSHYCNDKNDKCKEEDVHHALTSEMYLQDCKIVEIGLTTVTLEYFDGWHTTKQKYKKKFDTNWRYYMSAEVKITAKPGVVFEYFCIENTIDEWHTEVTGNYDSFDTAREALKHKSDWYSNKDTGRIYRCTFYREDDELELKKELVFRRTQRDTLDNTPGTYYN